MVAVTGALPQPVILTRLEPRLSFRSMERIRFERLKTIFRRLSMTVNIKVLRGLSLFTNLSESQLEKVAGR
jgi:hypothetical protein